MHLFTYELDLELLMYIVPHFIPLVFDVNYNENDPTYDPKDVLYTNPSSIGNGQFFIFLLPFQSLESPFNIKNP